MFKKLLIAYHYKQCRAKQFKTRQALEEYQQKKIKLHLAKLVKRSPFFSAYKGRLLSEYPIINKQIMMENFDDYTTINIKKEQAFNIAHGAEENRDFKPSLQGITVGLSSGTSGKRALFIVTPHERFKWAGIILAKVLPGSILGRYKIAFFLRANSNLYTTISQSKRIQFEFYDLIKPLEENLAQLEFQKPDIIVAPAQVLRIIASYQKQGKLKCQPKKIISVAEVLEEHDKKFIETCFNQPVHQVYQATEGFLASTCNHGNLHLNEEYVYFEKEWIDEKRGKFVPIITDFTRLSQPIIRYRLDDILVANNNKCSCGKATQIIGSIEGRLGDTLLFTDSSNYQQPIFSDMLQRMISNCQLEIEDYRITQLDEKHINIDLLIEKHEQHSAAPHIIKNQFDKLVPGHLMAINVNLVNSFTKHPINKLRRISNLSKRKLS